MGLQVVLSVKAGVLLAGRHQLQERQQLQHKQLTKALAVCTLEHVRLFGRALAPSDLLPGHFQVIVKTPAGYTTAGQAERP